MNNIPHELALGDVLFSPLLPAIALALVATWITTIILNKIVGAVAVYLLLGLIWATLYLIVLEFPPTAFNGIEQLNWEENFSVATCFSYVTLTTLGYGDISPAEPVSPVLVYLETMVGVFYMAVIIASLIGSRAGIAKTAAAIGGGLLQVLMFVVALLIAGGFMTYAESTGEAAHRLFVRLGGAKPGGAWSAWPSFSQPCARSV